jgi:deoxyribodipyrimidine photo-lyase
MKNDPNLDIALNISPYLHFGQLGAATIVFAARKVLRKFVLLLFHSPKIKGYDSFIEELVVRRELAENYCHCNKIMIILMGFRLGRQTLNQFGKKIDFPCLISFLLKK